MKNRNTSLDNDKELLNKCIEVKRILIASINTAKENKK